MGPQKQKEEEEEKRKDIRASRCRREWTRRTDPSSCRFDDGVDDDDDCDDGRHIVADDDDAGVG